MLNFMRTTEGITVILGGKPYHIAADADNFEEVVELIRGGAGEEALLEVVNRAVVVMQEVAEQLSEYVSYSGGLILYKGEPLHNYMCQVMLRMREEGFDLKPAALFLENLMNNPSYRVVEQLYSFLEYGKNPITEDGCFLAFKAIRKDWTDIHSGRFSNTIGTVVQMPRNQVDENPNQTCSKGLHVCSYDYLPHFAHADGRVVVCKVNPADVVAIPTDYNNTKMRCCKYEVVAEYAGYYTSESSNWNAVVVGSNFTPNAECFEVLHYQEGEDYTDANAGDWEDSFKTLEDAMQYCADVADDLSYGETLSVFRDGVAEPLAVFHFNTDNPEEV